MYDLSCHLFQMLSLLFIVAETEEDSISVSEDTDTQSQHSVSSDGSIASQRRTLTNVLSRLSSILDRGSSVSNFQKFHKSTSTTTTTTTTTSRI